MIQTTELPRKVARRWDGVSREEAIRQAEDFYKSQLSALEITIKQRYRIADLQEQVESLRGELESARSYAGNLEKNMPDLHKIRQKLVEWQLHEGPEWSRGLHLLDSLVAGVSLEKYGSPQGAKRKAGQ